MSSAHWSIPPGWSGATAEWAQQAARLSEAFRPAIELSAEVREALDRAVAPIINQLPDWLEQASRWGEQARRAILASYPPNWLHFDIGEVGEAIDLMLEHGLNVAWVPRVSIVRELVSAGDVAARDAVLIQREVEILDDVEASLSETTAEDLAGSVDALREAVECCRDGRHRASQALATVTLGTVVHDTLGEVKFADARRRFEALDPEEVPFIEARGAALLRCIARALQRTDVAGPGFNRHAAAHRLSADQYTQPNAIASLLLVAGLLREVDVLVSRKDERLEADDRVDAA
jgi:hypothetical protein